MLLTLGPPAVADQNLVGKSAPEIAASEWLNSKPMSLKALKGKVVVVEFWATWCRPCRASIPHLNEMFARYGKKGVAFVSLTDEDPATVQPFAREMGMKYPIGMASKSSEAYDVTGIPFAVIVGKNGKIAWTGHPMDPEMESALQKQVK